MVDKIYVGDIGTLIVIDIGEDISSAVDITLEVIPPKAKVRSDGTVIGGKSWVPEIVDSNFLSYTVIVGDLDEVGIWKINPKITMGTWTGFCNTVQFEVFNRGA